MRNTKGKNRNYLIVLAFILGIVIFVYFYFANLNQVEDVPEDNTSLDDWTIEDSPLNGLPLVENKTIYQLDQADDLDSIYITVFPTETDEGIIDFSIFDLQTARDRTFNPVLFANVTIGDNEGNLSFLVDTASTNATIQVRGNSSRGAKFKSYKIKFKTDEDDYKGFKVLNLNKHVSDPSKIANKFSMDIISQLDNMASFRTNFVKVYIKDQSLGQDQKYIYYGLYTNVEQPNKDFLTSHGLDVNGSLYKASNFEFRNYDELKNIDDPTYNQDEFDSILEFQEGKDHTKLIQMLDDINNLNVDFKTSFDKYFNEDNYLTWIAVNLLLGNEDTLAHNFIIYNPTNSLTWYLLPWDYDGTFKFGVASSSYGSPDSLKGIQRWTGVLLHRRYFISSENIDKLTKKMDELMTSTFSETNVNSLINSYIPVVEETLGKNPDVGLLGFEPNQLLPYIRGFYDEIKTNYDDYMTAMEYPTPVFTSTPVKNDDGSTLFAWEASRDYNGDLIKYSVRLAKDPTMKQIVFEETDLVDTTFTFNGDLKGTYFLEVKSVDSNGNAQYSLDTYSNPISLDFYFGIREVVFE